MKRNKRIRITWYSNNSNEYRKRKLYYRSHWIMVCDLISFYILSRLKLVSVYLAKFEWLKRDWWKANTVNLILSVGRLTNLWVSNAIWSFAHPQAFVFFSNPPGASRKPLHSLRWATLAIHTNWKTSLTTSHFSEENQEKFSQFSMKDLILKFWCMRLLFI